jgi:transposase
MDFDALTREELIALLKQAFATIEALQAQVAALPAEVVSLKQEIEQLKGGPPPKPKSAVPDFVKPNAPKRKQTPRKKRPHGFARKRQEPTQVVPHFPEVCSCCGRKLSGGWRHRVREVMELPVAPVEIIHHHVMARHCGVCNRREVASVDLSGVVLGKKRLGVRLMSTIAYLDTVCRMPVRLIQHLLSGLYGLALSTGEISTILQKVADKGKAEYDTLLSQMRASPVVHVDETSWREDGQNGYFWSFSTPTLRLYTGHEGRSGDVARRMLGKGFSNVLVTDFYGGYHWYTGLHQYCWVHLLRDIHKLHEQHPEEAEVAAFSAKVKSIYEQAKAFSHPSVFARQRQRRAYQDEIVALARAHQAAERPERVLAERILKHEWGLFVFVERPDVPSDNNAAERAIRPLVVVRKVSGGSRSEQGSQTVATLMSLFGTWQVRGANLLQQCQQMLASKPKPQPT